MGVTLSDVVVNCQSVREADCSVVGVASCAGVTEGEVHVLLCVVGERTTREAGSAFAAMSASDVFIVHLVFV